MGADWIAVVDVNGDGKPDLVVADGCNDTGATSGCASGTHGVVAVLLGNGNGTFQPAVPYNSGGERATSVAVDDVNGDGKPDVIVANYATGTVGVLLGNVDGTFQTAATYISGGYSTYSVAVGDVNKDGKPDIVVANLCGSYGTCPSGGTVGVLINTIKFPASTTTVLVSSSNPSLVKQPVTFTATITGAYGFTPSGSVTFKQGKAMLKVVTLANAQASYTTIYKTAGAYSITATYSGDVKFLGSTATLIQVVNKPRK